MWCCNNTLSETPTFYINYEECKYKCAVIDKLQQTGFILTMRNVNQPIIPTAPRPKPVLY